MIIFTANATPTAARFRTSGLFRSTAGVSAYGLADASMTATTGPVFAAAKGVDRPQASLGHIGVDAFATATGRVAGAFDNVPGVRAWSPPV
ncbi:MAG: hypothetical protein H0T14_05145 [Nocardioidaceae bacterium]|nr:hypothetical protein [Nocardioidaceae bacterium]